MAEYWPQAILAFAIIFLILTWVAVCLRVYVRSCIIKAFGPDDYSMVAALIFFTAYTACQIGGVVHGTGRQRRNLSDENAQAALKYWFFCELFFSLGSTFIKVSVGLFLLRIAIHKVQIWIIRFLIAGSLVFGAFYFFLILFQCSPISFWWNLDPAGHGTCISAKAFEVCGYIISVLNSVADLVFAILPMFIVWNTTMTRRTKVLVSVLLGFGSIAGIATIIRTPFIESLGEYKGNFLWNTRWVALMTTFEMGIGITAASVATFRPLVQRYVSGLGSRHYQSKPRLNDYSHERTPAPTKRGPLGHFMSNKSTTTTIITGRESWTHMPDLVMLESGHPVDFSETAELSVNKGRP